MPLRDRATVAVGSSATRRTLDMAAFERRFPGTRACNAAPCFLRADQTAFLAEFLLESMPRARTVASVVAPRDFASRSPQVTAFFDPDLAPARLFRGTPGCVLRVAGFRPLHLLRDAQRLRGGTARGGGVAHEDGRGSSIRARRSNRQPPPLRIDGRRYDGLARLEAAAAEAGARPAAAAALPAAFAMMADVEEFVYFRF